MITTETQLKASELRLGNYIYSDDEMVKVRSIYFHQGNYKIEWVWHLGDGVYNADDDGELKPIPLTPEILEKAGFERVTLIRYEKEDIALIRAMNGKYCFCYGNRASAAELEHLHQLQNLYFALTQTELEINL